MRTIIQTVIVAVGIVNIVLFAVWLSVIRVSAWSGDAAAASYKFDQLSFQLAMMQTVLGAVAILLAVAAFFGFQMVIERADKTAREVVQQLHKDGHLGAKGTGTVSANPPPTNVANVPVNNTTTETV
jgi:hypothetical protein